MQLELSSEIFTIRITSKDFVFKLVNKNYDFQPNVRVTVILQYLGFMNVNNNKCVSHIR